MLQMGCILIQLKFASLNSTCSIQHKLVRFKIRMPIDLELHVRFNTPIGARLRCRAPLGLPTLPCALLRIRISAETDFGFEHPQLIEL